MSDLYKKALKKQQKQEEDMDLEDEENDQVNTIPFENLHINQTGGPIKATQTFSIPQMPSSQTKSNKKIHDYSPLNWKDYFDSQDFMENGTPVYKAGTEGCIFFCLHGAGDSAASFCMLASEIRQFSSLVSFDFRGHGESKTKENVSDLSQETLIKDTIEVLKWCIQKWPHQNFVIVGHSMGGSIAAKFVEKAEQQFGGKIQGLVVIDVVEGTALEALPFMVNIVQSRPQKFESLESLINWSLKSQTLRNLQSARVSMPAKVYKDETDNFYKWKVDLLASEKYWVEWFKGLTQSFLSIRVPKLLMTAEKERMDKDLTIAQMQGRFRLIVLHNVGHYMQEDDYKGTALQLHNFLSQFKIPKTQEESNNLQTVGIGKFHPTVLPYNK